MKQQPGQLLGLAGGGVYPASVVTDTAVRSYRTISPLPVSRTEGARPLAVYFLWHFPAGRPGWLLTTTVPCPARTFLPAPVLMSHPSCVSFFSSCFKTLFATDATQRQVRDDRPTHSLNLSIDANKTAGAVC